MGYKTAEVGTNVNAVVTFYKKSGPVHVYVDDEEVANLTFTKRDTAIYIFRSLTVGNHTIKFTFDGNDTHESCSAEYELEITPIVPKESEINILINNYPPVNNTAEVETNQTIKIAGYFSSEFSGVTFDYMTVYIDQIETTNITPYTDWGSFEYNYTPTTPGIHEVKFTYAGSERYLPSEAYITIIATEPPKEYSLVVDTTEFTPGQTTNITASILFGTETLKDVATNITKGKITFKVNDKTLKDDSGKVIYAKVVNGTATIENYLVPDDWAKEGTTIQAVYSGSTQCEKLTSEKTEITVEKAAPTLTTESVTATAGSTIQLKATITDGNKVINTGKVVFKINGKTVKDENGKVIYAKVVDNQVIINYTLPSDMKAKEYNITATFISNDYERLEDTKVLNVTD